MFERNRVDNSPEQNRVPVEVEMASGEVEKGKIMVPMGRGPLDVLNAAGGFLEFEPYGGERRFVAKSQIAGVRLAGVPRSPRLTSGRQDDFDPHAVLGIGPDCSWDDIRQAYVRLSKAYHPDRYSNAMLPDEVREYLETMARRINAAYAALDTSQRVVKQSTAARIAPIYTSPQRGRAEPL